MEINTLKESKKKQTLSTRMCHYVHIVAAAAALVNPRSIIVVISSKCHCTRAAAWLCTKNGVYTDTHRRRIQRQINKQQAYRMSDGTPIERYVNGREKSVETRRDDPSWVETQLKAIRYNDCDSVCLWLVRVAFTHERVECNGVDRNSYARYFVPQLLKHINNSSGNGNNLTKEHFCASSVFK